MSRQHLESDGELRRLIAAVCDGHATVAECEQLQTRLLADPAAREYYVGYLDLHAELQWRSRGTTLFRPMGDREMGGQSWRPLVRLQRLLLRPTPFSLTTAALVMVLLITALAFMSAPIYRAVMRGGVAPENSIVAEISRTHKAVWRPLGSAEENRLLAVGQEIELVDGLAEIWFYRGARLTLEGPVILRIAGGNSVILDHGKLVANVSDSATGFEIDTSLANIRDLGTEFAVAVTQQAGTEVQVFQGKVEVRLASNSDAQPHLVVAGERFNIAPSGVAVHRPAAKGAAVFVRRVPPQRNELRVSDAYVQAIRQAEPVIYWRCESESGDRIANEMSSKHALEVVGGVRLLPTDENNNAAVFGGTRDPHYLVCRDADMLAGSQYTVELWCQPYTHSRPTMVMLGLGRNAVTDSLMLSLDGAAADSAAIRGVRYLHRCPPGDSGGTNLESVESLTVGLWHHVAAVYDQGAMRLYVNGALVESTTPRPLSADARMLLLGRLRTNAGDARAFIGRLDEIAIYNRALDEAEISKHHKLVRKTR